MVEIGGLLAELIRTGRVPGAAPVAEDGATGIDGGGAGVDGRAPSAAGVPEGLSAGSAGMAGSGGAGLSPRLPAQGTGGSAAAVAPQVIRAAIHIHEQGPQTVGQLAAGLGISQGWASRIVDDLERAGYVERERDPRDRRVVRVGLTPMAAARVERVARWHGDAVEASLAGMSAEERAAVATFLRRFLERTRPTG